MSRVPLPSRTAVRFLLLADLLIALTMLLFAAVSWTAETALPSKLLATFCTVIVLAFAVADALHLMRRLRLAARSQQPQA